MYVPREDPTSVVKSISDILIGSKSWEVDWKQGYRELYDLEKCYMGLEPNDTHTIVIKINGGARMNIAEPVLPVPSVPVIPG